MEPEIWIEHYRPSNFDEFIDQHEAIERLRAYVNEGNIPNLVFHGPKGTGKTSMTFVLARELYGEYWEDNLVYFDASDFFELGKRYLRSEPRFERFFDENKSVLDCFKRIVREYASLAPIGVDFKIVFFNNASSLTRDAQQALRRMMEKYNKTCRFIFATTQISKLISPIRSRCLCLHFGPMTDDAMRDILRRIAASERIEVEPDGIDAIVYKSNGNTRDAINTLQAASAVDHVIDANTIYEIIEEEKEIDVLIESAISNDFIKSREILDSLLIDQGLSGSEILELIADDIRRLNIPEDVRLRMLICISNVEASLLVGLNDRIQLERLIAEFSNLRSA